MIELGTDETYSLQGITFVWNIKKSRKNLANHHINFEQACEVFFDPFLCVLDASRKDEVQRVVGVMATVSAP